MTNPRTWFAATTLLAGTMLPPVLAVAPLPVRIDAFQGEVVQVSGASHSGVTVDKPLAAGTVVKTGRDGLADLSLHGEPTLHLGHGVDLLLHSIDQEVLRIRVAAGTLHVDTRTPAMAEGKGRDVRLNAGDLRLRVANAQAWIEVSDRTGQVCVISGVVEAQQPAGAVRLDTPGQCLRQTGVSAQWTMVPVELLTQRVAAAGVPRPVASTPRYLPKPPLQIKVMPLPGTLPEAEPPAPVVVLQQAPATEPVDVQLALADVPVVPDPPSLPALPAAAPKIAVKAPSPVEVPVVPPPPAPLPVAPAPAQRVAVRPGGPVEVPVVPDAPKAGAAASVSPRPSTPSSPSSATAAAAAIASSTVAPNVPASPAAPADSAASKAAVTSPAAATPPPSAPSAAPASSNTPVPGPAAPPTVVAAAAPPPSVSAAPAPATAQNPTVDLTVAATAPPVASPVAPARPKPVPIPPEPLQTAATAPAAPAAAKPSTTPGANPTTVPASATAAAPTPITLAAAAPATAPTAADDGRRWRVVLGSMPEKEKAEVEAERLNARGWAVEAREYRVGDRRGYRIGFGEFAAREDAQKALEEFLVQFPDAPAWLAKY